MLGVMQALAGRKAKVDAVGVIALAENMPSGTAQRPSDIVTSMSGQPIEVLNTDAEGRLVLADALHVAVEQKPTSMIDLATLTGACVVALGNDVVGAMSNDQAWCGQVLDAARRCGEPIWQLPMFDEYGDEIRSEVAANRQSTEFNQLNVRTNPALSGIGMSATQPATGTA